MADDVMAVFDALGWADGHLFGASMGSVIAQAVAVRHADRVRSLTLQSTTPGTSPLLNRPKLGAVLKTGREVGADTRSTGARPAGWPSTTGSNPKGDLRHLAAGDRRKELTGLQVPTLVIHGEADRELWPAIVDEMERMIKQPAAEH